MSLPNHSLTIRATIPARVGMLGRVLAAISDGGGQVGGVDIVRSGTGSVTRDIAVYAHDEAQGAEIARAVAGVDGVAVESSLDRVFLAHAGGTVGMRNRVPVASRDDLSMAYTPGVARVCRAIADAPEAAWNLTIKHNTVAVVSDGTAVLGLGDIGPEAAMPVMEGKAVLFKEFGGIDAWPICLATKDADEIVAIVKAIAPGFGGINLEDISAPRCFEIERRLRDEIDIPVFHDDQHGTAIVTLAALVNALRVVGKPIEDVKIVIAGVGAAGVAVTDVLLHGGATTIVGCDREGAVYRGRPGLSPVKADYAERTNPHEERGSADDVLAGADVFIGLSSPGAISVQGVRSMASDAIVFAMANPTPEVAPEEIEGHAAVIATGRSDYPNQINNVLAFPGVFRGALDVRASDITDGMKVAASHALALVIPSEELDPDHIIASVFNRDVAPAVAAAVAEAAERDGVARRPTGG